MEKEKEVRKGSKVLPIIMVHCNTVVNGKEAPTESVVQKVPMSNKRRLKNKAEQKDGENAK